MSDFDLFGGQNSLFSEEQMEEFSIVIKRYSEEEIIQDAYDYFQVVGFPYPTLTLFEMKQEINKLAFRILPTKYDCISGGRYFSQA